MRSTAAIEYVYKFRRDRIAKAYEIYERRKSNVPLAKRDSWGMASFTIDGHKFKPWMLEPDTPSRNSRTLSHLRSCQDFESAASSRGPYEWRLSPELVKLSRDVAEEIWANSLVLRNIVETHGGLWVESLQTLKRRSAYEHSLIGTDREGEVNGLERLSMLDFLLPNYDSWAKAEMNIRNVKSFEVVQHVTKGQIVEAQPRYFTMGLLMDLVLEEVNERRSICEHYLKVSCQICGETAPPNLLSAVEWRFPIDLCHKCTMASDYHGSELVEEGVDPLMARQSMLDAVKLLVEITGYPIWEKGGLDGHSYYDLDISSRPLEDRALLLKIMACLAQLGGVSPYWETKYHFLSDAGLETHIPRGKSRGIRSISACNHLCLSEGERKICEGLFKRGLEHTREPIYSDLVRNPESYNGLMRGDFLVGELVIEFAGLAGDAGYDAKMEDKRNLCASNGIPLLVIQPSDLKKLDAILDELLG